MGDNMYDKLRKIRKNNGESVDKMMNLLNLKTKAAYYKKENGTINFTLLEAKKIAEHFNASIDEIFF